ncbi:hypothetical protein [Microlunatus flavus]|uniref:hypothetical protein n=1 Tax=Microlunatus flavus TaxID=1036181 RepID=UPI001113ACBE|nr:hypothetical protein [Microlunatus flavus]
MTPVDVTPEVRHELESWPDLSLALGTPVDIEAGSIPSDGIRITRRYVNPVPAEASATLAYFDSDIQTWRAVPSTIAPDRLSVSAVVHHLSRWTDFTTAVGDCAKAIGDCGYYHVGKIFSDRAEAPTCRSGLQKPLTERRPDWVDTVSFIELSRNNPILICAGPAKDDRKLEVKATVNRGFGFVAEVTSQADDVHNTTADAEDLRDAVSDATHLDNTFGKSMEALIGSNKLVAGTETYSFELSEDEGRRAPQQLLVMKPPNTTQFLLSLLATLVGKDLSDKADGLLAAAILVGACGTDIQAAKDDSSWGKALLSCVQGLDDGAARRLSTYLLERGVQNPGATAGKIVGRATIYLALVGPLFESMNYLGERTTPDSARNVSLFVRPDGVTRATFKAAEVPAYCQNVPAQRLKSGTTTKGGPGQGWIAGDAAAAYLDLGHLGYKQGFVTYQCSAGGVGWPGIVLDVGAGGTLLHSYKLEKLLLYGDRTSTTSLKVDGDSVVVSWSDHLGAGGLETQHQTTFRLLSGELRPSDKITSYSCDASAKVVLDAAAKRDRASLNDRQAASDQAWNALIAQVPAGEDAYPAGCQDIGGGQFLSEVSLDQGSLSLVLRRATGTRYGWRVSDVPA